MVGEWGLSCDGAGTSLIFLVSSVRSIGGNHLIWLYMVTTPKKELQRIPCTLWGHMEPKAHPTRSALKARNPNPRSLGIVWGLGFSV